MTDTVKQSSTKPKDYIPLAEKIAKANKDIGVIAKDGNNNFQHYSFQSEAAIKAAVQRVISDNKFAIVPSFEIVDREQQKTAKGGVNNFVYVLGTFTITDGIETMVGSMPGAGSDTGEKAVQKACTSAQKYFYKQLFNITDKDEDPDAQDSNPNGGYTGAKRSTAKRKQTAKKKLSNQQLLNYEIADAKGPVKLVQVIAEAVAGNQESAATLHKLGGESKEAYALIYKNKLYKDWPGNSTKAGA